MRTGCAQHAHTAAPISTRVTVHRSGPDGTSPLGSTVTTVATTRVARTSASGRRAAVTAGVVVIEVSSKRARVVGNEKPGTRPSASKGSVKFGPNPARTGVTG